MGAAVTQCKMNLVSESTGMCHDVAEPQSE